MTTRKKIIRVMMLAAIVASLSLMKSTIASLNPDLPMIILIFAGLLNVCRFISILGLFANQKIGTIAFIIFDLLIILMGLFIGFVNIEIALIDLLLIIPLIIDNNVNKKATVTNV